MRIISADAFGRQAIQGVAVRAGNEAGDRHAGLHGLYDKNDYMGSIQREIKFVRSLYSAAQLK